jgi:hypothetical protein
MVQKTSLFYVRSVPLPFLHLAKGNSRQNSRRANRRRLPAFGSRSLGPGFKINDVTLAEFQDIRNCSRWKNLDFLKVHAHASADGKFRSLAIAP